VELHGGIWTNGYGNDGQPPEAPRAKNNDSTARETCMVGTGMGRTAWLQRSYGVAPSTRRCSSNNQHGWPDPDNSTGVGRVASHRDHAGITPSIESCRAAHCCASLSRGPFETNRPDRRLTRVSVWPQSIQCALLFAVLHDPARGRFLCA
jgi:hypothetical protein